MPSWQLSLQDSSQESIQLEYHSLRRISAAQRKGERARIGTTRQGCWKEVETKVVLDYLGEAERTWAYHLKQKKKKATIAVARVRFPGRRA